MARAGHAGNGGERVIAPARSLGEGSDAAACFRHVYGRFKTLLPLSSPLVLRRGEPRELAREQLADLFHCLPRRAAERVRLLLQRSSYERERLVRVVRVFFKRSSSHEP